MRRYAGTAGGTGIRQLSAGGRRYLFPGHYEPVPQLSGVVYDEKGYFAAMEFLRQYAEEHHAQILFGHDMKQFQSLKKSTEGFYQ